MRIKSGFIRSCLSSTSTLALAGFTFAGSAQADGVWTGTTDEDWTNASNWDNGAVPNGGTDVFIHNGAGVAPVIHNSLVSANNVSVGDSVGAGVLTVEAGTTLTTNGDFVMGEDGGANEGVVTVTGAGTLLNIGGVLTLNDNGANVSTLVIGDGASVQTGDTVTIHQGAVIQSPAMAASMPADLPVSSMTVQCSSIMRAAISISSTRSAAAASCM